MRDLKKLVTLCQGHPVYIQTHNFPDPDAIASAYGLQKLLEIYGTESELCYEQTGLSVSICKNTVGTQPI